ncbi:PTS sugar transporter subunit IIA [Spiroplasma helicoides]|nr:PTS sugar transporter subunit IIA [Spiroplasma helicoides]
MKKERQLRILYTLINYKNIESKVIINHFDISDKTLNRDLEEINDFLQKLGNFKLLLNETDIKFIGNTEDILNYLQLDDKFLLKEERLLYILLTLLRDQTTTKLQIIDDLDISANILEDDLEELNGLLKKYDLKLLINKQGIKVPEINKNSEISILIDITTKYILFKKVYSVLKLNKIEKLFSNYIYNFLKNRYQINVYNKIFYWLIEFTSNQINVSNLNLIILAIKITYWLNHPKNKKILDQVEKIEYYNEFVTLAKDIYSSDDIGLFFIKQALDDDSNNKIKSFIKDLNQDIKKLFNNKMALSDEMNERIINHISSNLFVENVDEFIIEEYSRNLDSYKIKYKELWYFIEKNLKKYFNDKKNINLLIYEIFIHVLVWFDSYIYEKKLKFLTICIGGMGQSAMIKNHLSSLYRNAVVKNISYSMINKDKLKNFDLVISSIDISETNLDNLIVMPIILLLSKKNEIHKIISEKLYENLVGEKMKNEILKKDNIKINQTAKNKVEAIKQCGQLLKQLGYVEESYIDSMIEREKKFSVYIGNYLAIPHGMDDKGVIKDGIVIMHYKNPVDYDSNPVNFFIGIAAKSDKHVDILANIAEKMMELELVEDLIKNPSEDRFLQEFNF